MCLELCIGTISEVLLSLYHVYVLFSLPQTKQ